MAIRLSGIGGYIPERRITNQHWEALVSTTDEWIMQNLGIKERSRAGVDETTTDMAIHASQIAIKQAGVSLEEIDYVICATNSQDDLYPSTASKIQKRLGIKKATALDIQAGCTGWLFAARLAQSLLLAEEATSVLAIGSDALTRFLNFKNRDGILFGDAAGAGIFQNSDSKGRLSKFIFSTGTEPSDAMKCPTIYTERLNPMEDYLEGKDMTYVERPLPNMDGKTSMKLALVKTMSAIQDVLAKAQKLGIEKSDIKAYIPHQTNVHIVKKFCEELGFTLESIPYTLERFGGISTATLPVAMQEHFNKGKLKTGDIVLCSSYGAGFTYGAMIFEWGI